MESLALTLPPAWISRLTSGTLLALAARISCWSSSACASGDRAGGDVAAEAGVDGGSGFAREGWAGRDVADAEGPMVAGLSVAGLSEAVLEASRSEPRSGPLSGEPELAPVPPALQPA